MYHLQIAGHVCIFPFCRMRKACFPIIVFMAFYVGFIFQINTVFVAQMVPIGIVGIMAVAYVVDVGAFHEHYFLFHLFTGDGMSAFWICFMTVHSFHLDRLAVEIIVASGKSEFVFLGRSVLYFYFPESYDGRESLGSASFLVLQFTDKGISVRTFRTPRLHLRACVQSGAYHGFFTAAQLSDRFGDGDIFYRFVLVAV